jgi:uncharacterized protein YbjT (DUF2867 family)
MDRTALIIGASGLVGGFCLNKLLNEPKYCQITALVRRPLNKSHPKLIEKIIDFDQIKNNQKDIQGQDVYCCIGTTFLKSPKPSLYEKIDFTYPYEIALIAQKNGAERFALVSALTADPKGLFFYSRVKGKLEEAIKKLNFQSTVILRPSYLVGERKEFRPIEKMGVMILKILSPILLGPLQKMRPIEANTVATVLVDLCLAGKPEVSLYLNDKIQQLYDDMQSFKKRI